MASYNAGYINVAGDAYFDPSGSDTAVINAANVTVNGTLTTNNLSVPTLNTANNFTVNHQLKVGTFNYLNQTMSQDYKDTIDSLVNTYAWDASKNGTETVYTAPGFAYGTILPCVNLDGSYNTTFTPIASVFTDINGEIYFKSKGNRKIFYRKTKFKFFFKSF